jgi:hypothetical protein
VSLSFELRLEERLEDRVIVSVLLSPCGGPASVDGVAVELFSRDHESLSPRMLLPISGALYGPIAVKVELRSGRPIPAGAVVAGTAWWPTDSQCATVPADPYTELEAHMRGKRAVSCRMTEEELVSLDRRERGRLAVLFPWIDRKPLCAKRAAAAIDEPLDVQDAVDDISEELGLDEENTRWLRELLQEEDG